MLQNDYLLAKIGADPAENEPRKERGVVTDTVISLPSEGKRTELSPAVSASAAAAA